MTTDPLYEMPDYEGQCDYLPDTALERIRSLVIDRLPHAGFDLASSQASTKTVTATLAFENCPGPLAQQEALEAVLQGATVLRTLYANLVAARAALGEVPK